MVSKEREKIDNYCDLKYEIKSCLKSASKQKCRGIVLICCASIVDKSFIFNRVSGFVLLKLTKSREWLLSTLVGQKRPFLLLIGAYSKRSCIWICRFGGHELMTSNHFARWNLELSFSSSPSIVTGTLGTVSRGFGMWLGHLGMLYCMELLQEITLLGSGRILRKVLLKSC